MLNMIYQVFLVISYRIQTSLGQKGIIISWNPSTICTTKLWEDRDSAVIGAAGTRNQKCLTSHSVSHHCFSWPSGFHTLSLQAQFFHIFGQSPKPLPKRAADFLLRTLIRIAKVRCPLMDCLILSWQQGHTEVWKFPYADILCVHVYAYGGGWLGAVPKCREQRMLDVNTVDVL